MDIILFFFIVKCSLTYFKLLISNTKNCVIGVRKMKNDMTNIEMSSNPILHK